MKEEMKVAILDLDLRQVRALLDEVDDQESCFDEGECVLHELIDTVSAEVLLSSPHRRRLIYMLSNAGFNVNETDKGGNTALHLCLDCLNGDPEICEPLLQAGAEVHIKNNAGVDVLQKVTACKTLSEKSRAIFKKYHLGIWQAVEADNLLDVRKLINLWCHVHIKKDGKTLKGLALDKGTEHIIRLIIEIAPSMALAHSVLAEDVKSVRKLLTTNKDINLEFRNLGDMGATPLYYAISWNNPELVELLVSAGAKLDAVITIEDEEMPILFTALHADIDVEIIKQLIPNRDSSSFSLVNQHYKGNFVLHYCIEKCVPLTAVRYILHKGYSEMVALRDVHNRCPRGLAMTLGRHEYVKVIDECVHDWCLDNETTHRRTLALMGYTHLLEAEKDGVRACDVIQTMETSSEQAQFDTQLLLYQEQTAKLAMAIENGDLENVKNLMYFTTDHPDSFYTCLAQGKPKGDGQPLLHKAVLQGHLEIVDYIAKVIVQTLKIKVDELRDQCLRTALHYAYAMENGKPLYNCLLDYGASEFTMDKDCRSPLAFRDLRDHPEMAKLIQWHKHQKYDSAEPDPWKVKMPRRRGQPLRGGHRHSHGGGMPAGPQGNQLGYGPGRTFPSGQMPNQNWGYPPMPNQSWPGQPFPGASQWPPGMPAYQNSPPAHPSGCHPQQNPNFHWQPPHSHGQNTNWPPGPPPNWPGQQPNWPPGQNPYGPPGQPPNWPPGQNWPTGQPPGWPPGPSSSQGQSSQSGRNASGESKSKTWSYWDYCTIS